MAESSRAGRPMTSRRMPRCAKPTSAVRRRVAMAKQPLLEIENIETRYGRSQVLFGISLTIAAGEMVSLMGRNGMGKTTTVRSVMGLTPAIAGAIRFDGADVRRLPPYRIAQHGIGLVPEGRQVFPNLTARENLLATASNRRGVTDSWTLEKVEAMFPQLAERAATMGRQLSGGEQQMLAIGRALMTNPRLIILDEATEGLAPLIRDEIWRCLTALKMEGQAILVVDKDVEALIRLADSHFMLEKGRVVWNGTTSSLREHSDLRKRYLSI